MSDRLDRLLREIEGLAPDELRALLGAVARRLAVPLRDAGEFFDDWDDPEADRAYLEALRLAAGKATTKSADHAADAREEPDLQSLGREVRSAYPVGSHHLILKFETGE